MNRYIRFDDYPVREKVRPEEYDRWLFRILALCGKHRVRYILGVVPEKISLYQGASLLQAMNTFAPSGRVVMHGFTHAYDRPAMVAREMRAAGWDDMYKAFMTGGGEFSGMSIEECLLLARHGVLRLREFFGDLFDDNHFIAPFNRYTEPLVQALASEGCVRYIHGSDEARYGFDHRGIERVESHFKFGYDYAGAVAARLPAVLQAGEQITLHWFYDCTKRSHWEDEYSRLLDGLSKDPEYVTTA